MKITKKNLISKKYYSEFTFLFLLIKIQSLTRVALQNSIKFKNYMPYLLSFTSNTDIWMVFFGQSSVSIFNFFGGGDFANSENVIIVLSGSKVSHGIV